MNLLLLFDHRFLRGPDGVVFSDKSYDYRFFRDRYLRVFDQVSILARVADVPISVNSAGPTEGKGVKVLALPDWVGPTGYLRHRKLIVDAALREASKPSAVIMIVPGGIGSITYRDLRRRGHHLALEVVGDPWDAFQPGAIRHPLRPLLRRCLFTTLRRQCSHACAVSYVTSEYLQHRYPSKGFSFSVSDVVLPDTCFVSQPRKFASSGTGSLISVAVMNGCKGHEVMIEALRISRDMGCNFNIVMVGDGPLRSKIQQTAEAYGLVSHIRFAGQLSAGSAVRKELDSAGLFVLPSLTEGMPRALLEAMARGLPCIASRVGGVPEVLHSDCLVAPGDPHALALKLRSLTSDPAELSRMSERNLQRAREFADSKLSITRQEFYSQVRKINEQPRALFV